MKIIFLALTLFLSASLWAQEDKAVVTIQADMPQQIISKNIYGHFAEHLGRCIYDGFWVDSNLNVAKEGRIRMDIVNAQKYKSSRFPLARWLLCR